MRAHWSESSGRTDGSVVCKNKKKLDEGVREIGPNGASVKLSVRHPRTLLCALLDCLALIRERCEQLRGSGSGAGDDSDGSGRA